MLLYSAWNMRHLSSRKYCGRLWTTLSHALRTGTEGVGPLPESKPSS